MLAWPRLPQPLARKDTVGSTSSWRTPCLISPQRSTVAGPVCTAALAHTRFMGNAVLVGMSFTDELLEAVGMSLTDELVEAVEAIPNCKAALLWPHSVSGHSGAALGMASKARTRPLRALGLGVMCRCACVSECAVMPCWLGYSEMARQLALVQRCARAPP